MPGTEEDALISRAKEGDGRAFGLLYEKHRSQIRNVICGRVRDPDDRDDLVQMTFVRAYRALPRFRGHSRFSTWLHRIALNLCTSHARSYWSRKVRLDEMEDPEGFLAGIGMTGTAHPGRTLISHSIEAAIHGEINSLPEHYREPTWLRFVDERSYSEVAQDLQMPMGTVKTRLHRGRGILQDRLEWVRR